MSEKLICGDCIQEEFFFSYVKKVGKRDKCSYCGKSKKVLELSEIADLIEDGIVFIYDDPANGLGFIDGEYVTGTRSLYSTYDLLFEFGFAGSKACDDILEKLPDGQWCHKEFYGFDVAEENIYTWEYFVEQIKYKSRYFFIKEKTDIQRTVRYSQPVNILNELVRIINDLALLDTLKKGEVIYRARKNKGNKIYSLAEELGTPPAENCIYPNRMSPSGIPMFYGSKTKETCLSEIYDKKGMYTIGEWEVLKDLRILNLTRFFKFDLKNGQYYYPEFPSIFDQTRRGRIHDYTFILKFASDLSKKMKKDGKENIDYVPTQVVAEYLRTIARFNRKHIDGICFYSSKSEGVNYALFIEQKECLKKVDHWKDYHQKLELKSIERIRLFG